MNIPAIILAGGLGTRLRSEVSDLPKVMAPVAGRPFLEHVLDELIANGVDEAVLSVGYKAEIIQSHFGNDYKGCKLLYVLEEEPLGTGGGIALALKAIKQPNAFVVNGDTLFRVPLERLAHLHANSDAELAMALKPMKNFDRYGTVSSDAQDHITAFHEKQPCESGNINGGVYAIDRQAFLARNWPEKFSFEKDYLEAYVAEGHFMALTSDTYFIDIGIPEDYQRAQHELA